MISWGLDVVKDGGRHPKNENDLVFYKSDNNLMCRCWLCDNGGLAGSSTIIGIGITFT